MLTLLLEEKGRDEVKKISIMKKYSDYFSFLTRVTNRVGSRIATTALFMVAAITMGFAQTADFTFIEGSVHSFRVDNHPGNTFAWNVRNSAFGAIDPAVFTIDEGQFEPSVTVRFNDMQRVAPELLYLAVTETGTNGCSTTRALRIMIEPNNMYLEFASNMTNECFTPGDYNAPLKIGLNFNNKAAGVAIPEEFFPLALSYTVTNMTDGVVVVSEKQVEVPFSADNNYFLMISEAQGRPNETVEYELEINEVVAQFDTKITNNGGDFRIQFRVINHLPQSGTMDMAMAYVVTGIEYLGEN